MGGDHISGGDHAENANGATGRIMRVGAPSGVVSVEDARDPRHGSHTNVRRLKWFAWPRFPLRRIQSVLAAVRALPLGRPPLMGCACDSECCFATKYRLVGFADPALTSSFPTRLRGFPPAAVPRRLRDGFILSSASLPSRVSRVTARPAPPDAEHLPWGSAPLRDINRWSPLPAGLPSPLRSAHDVSHVLDGLLLHRSLRVYFTPQPRPGFALQGFSLPRRRSSSSLARALLPLV
jgi:hypothetical protein